MSGAEERCGAEGGSSHISKDLQSTTTATALGGAKALLLAAAYARSEVCEQKDDEDGEQGSRPCGKAEHHGKNHSGEGRSGGDRPYSPGAEGKGQGETDGGK